MCATVRKRSRWKCCQGQKNGIFPIGNFKRSIFFPPFLHTSMCSRFSIVFPVESNQKQFTCKEYYHTKSAGFYERRVAVEIGGLVLRGGPRRGRRWADGRLLFLSDENSIRSVSGICMHAAKQVSSPLSHVTRAPGETPGVDASLRVGETPPRGSLAFTAEMLMKA